MFKKLYNFLFVTTCGCTVYLDMGIDLHSRDSINTIPTQRLLAFLYNGAICQSSGNRIVSTILTRIAKD